MEWLPEEEFTWALDENDQLIAIFFTSIRTAQTNNGLDFKKKKDQDKSKDKNVKKNKSESEKDNEKDEEVDEEKDKEMDKETEEN